MRELKANIQPYPMVDYDMVGGQSRGGNTYWGKDGFGFDDFIDIVNPLQHIPVISSIYRALTGDEISPGARMAGGTLYGGPLGFAAAVVNAAIEEGSGKAIGANLIAMVFGDDASDTPGIDNREVMVASKSPPAAPAQPAPVVEIEKKAPDRVHEAVAAKAQIGTPAQHRAAIQAAHSRTPQMSPQAFKALMSSLGAVPVEQAVPAPGWKYGGGPTLLAGSARAASKVTAAGPAAPMTANIMNALPSPALHRQGLEMHRLLGSFYGSEKVLGQP